MDIYTLVKTLHILSATVLFGTGLGIAFFMFSAHFAQNLHEKYFAARFTVLADFCFTLPAVITQPATGLWLIHLAGYDPAAFWLKCTYWLYALAGICWLPVVWIQIELRRMLKAALFTGTAPPARYNKLFRIWFCFGWPAFMALIAIFYLMVAKPT